MMCKYGWGSLHCVDNSLGKTCSMSNCRTSPLKMRIIPPDASFSICHTSQRNSTSLVHNTVISKSKSWSAMQPFALSLGSSFSRAAEFRAEPRNFRVFAEFHGILHKHGNSAATAKFVRLYCCCNCDTQSLRTTTQDCWFQWRVFTFSLLTYLSFYLLDLCRWRWLVTETDWLARLTDEWRRFFGLLFFYLLKLRPTCRKVVIVVFN